MAASVWEIVSNHHGERALGAPGRPWLSGQRLRDLVGETVASLNGVGIGRGDRVAIVLPNGPEAATSFLGVACACTAAPLNPAYKAAEFEFYLSDLKPRAVIARHGEASPVREVAAKLGIPVIELVPDEAGAAGRFRLDTATMPRAEAIRHGRAGPDDVALVLHTSGTTARPKIVPLTNANLAASAAHIAHTLRLAPGDVCLNIMPLFHIHGLIAATLSSLAAGAAACCTPGFNAFRFAEWIGEVRPTWYTAVPTMHQGILMRAGKHRELMREVGLRFVRSSSASLPPQVMAELEALFGAPVIEAYGMTEASHQMASNPLPPRARKPGSVGLAAGPEIAIMDESGTILPPGAVGEVVIRGPNVTLGYANNPAANEKAFTSGWFRTGDQGQLDADGYLVLTGRLKELINRGGEKVSPIEVDVALLDHPAVAEACTFAIPHEVLGEEVGAVVVPREGAALTEQEVRDFAAGKLAPFKVPRHVIVRGDIPKGPTGKVQRIGLAERLGLAS
ncbi:MAG: AMP-binding protein [Acetobacteraceae bacterium]|nr:AMP-binding protein [Acetobacteraceae bacterium]